MNLIEASKSSTVLIIRYLIIGKKLEKSWKILKIRDFTNFIQSGYGHTVVKLSLKDKLSRLEFPLCPLIYYSCTFYEIDQTKLKEKLVNTAQHLY